MSRIAEALQRAGVATPERTASGGTLDSFAGAPDSPASEVAGTPAPPEPVPFTSGAAAGRLTPAPAISGGPMAVLGPPRPKPAALSFCAKNERLVTSPNMVRVAAEQYRKMASALHQLQIERNLRSVLVTSAVVGEGKTLTATNLALTLGESFRRRVLLVDADLRRPKIHALFGIHAEQGLSSVLRAGSEPVAPLIGISDRLALLPGGPPDPDPVSGLSSERMRHLLEDAAEVFDWVIVDSPPVGLVPDGSLLSMLVNGVVLVVRASSTASATLQRTVAAITPERIVGAVLNQAARGSHADYGYLPEEDDYTIDHGATPGGSP